MDVAYVLNDHHERVAPGVLNRGDRDTLCLIERCGDGAVVMRNLTFDDDNMAYIMECAEENVVGLRVFWDVDRQVVFRLGDPRSGRDRDPLELFIDEPAPDKSSNGEKRDGEKREEEPPPPPPRANSSSHHNPPPRQRGFVAPRRDGPPPQTRRVFVAPRRDGRPPQSRRGLVAPRRDDQPPPHRDGPILEEEQDAARRQTAGEELRTEDAESSESRGLGADEGHEDTKAAAEPEEEVDEARGVDSVAYEVAPSSSLYSRGDHPIFQYVVQPDGSLKSNWMHYTDDTFASYENFEAHVYSIYGTTEVIRKTTKSSLQYFRHAQRLPSIESAPRATTTVVFADERSQCPTRPLDSVVASHSSSKRAATSNAPGGHRRKQRRQSQNLVHGMTVLTREHNTKDSILLCGVDVADPASNNNVGRITRTVDQCSQLVQSLGPPARAEFWGRHGARDLGDIVAHLRFYVSRSMHPSILVVTGHGANGYLCDASAAPRWPLDAVVEAVLEAAPTLSAIFFAVCGADGDAGIVRQVGQILKKHKTWVAGCSGTVDFSSADSLSTSFVRAVATARGRDGVLGEAVGFGADLAQRRDRSLRVFGSVL